MQRNHNQIMAVKNKPTQMDREAEKKIRKKEKYRRLRDAWNKAFWEAIELQEKELERKKQIDSEIREKMMQEMMESER